MTYKEKQAKIAKRKKRCKQLKKRLKKVGRELVRVSPNEVVEGIQIGIVLFVFLYGLLSTIEVNRHFWDHHEYNPNNLFVVAFNLPTK